MAEVQFPRDVGGASPREGSSLANAKSVSAPDAIRIVVKDAGSISPGASADRQRSELAAKAKRAAVVSAAVCIGVVRGSFIAREHDFRHDGDVERARGASNLAADVATRLCH